MAAGPGPNRGHRRPTGDLKAGGTLAGPRRPACTRCSVKFTDARWEHLPDRVGPVTAALARAPDLPTPVVPSRP